MWSSTLPTIETFNDKLIRLPQVLEISGLCRSVVYKLVNQGQFPAQVTVGTRGARWSELEVRIWVADRLVNARRTNESAA
ncbi:AlpA family phage regulatory protein [Edaphobacter aggregans]|uniref:helix-turn-helix transcriptional regulator n=1 Tax=Edaphobacter aggregans TaxID=570835 RepID=UPI0009FD3D1B